MKMLVISADDEPVFTGIKSILDQIAFPTTR
jgi:hypothetical protein